MQNIVENMHEMIKEREEYLRNTLVCDVAKQYNLGFISGLRKAIQLIESQDTPYNPSYFKK